MTWRIEASVNSFVSACRFQDERLADNGPQAAPRRFYEKILDFRTLGITSIVTGILSKLATAMASTIPTLSFVGKTLAVISGVGFIATGIVGLTAMLWAVYCLIHIDDIRNANQTPFATLFSDFQFFSQEFQRKREPLKNQERETRAAFINREIIPEEFGDDEVLSQYICPIAQNLIRHPTTDPTSGRVYERTAIEEWIDRHHTSPLSRAPLEKDQLVPNREVQERIDNRLRELQERQARTRQHIQAFLASRQETREVNEESERNLSTEVNREDPQQTHSYDAVPQERKPPTA